MNGLAEVIPIASRRNRRSGTPAPKAIQPAVAAQARRRRLVGFCAVLVAAVLALVVMDRTVIPHSPPPAPLPAEARAGLFQRALADVAGPCQLPEAAASMVRQHCVEQARFLQQLPECKDDCAAQTRAVLNHR